jgi:hypothetical protein
MRTKNYPIVLSLLLALFVSGLVQGQSSTVSQPPPYFADLNNLVQIRSMIGTKFPNMTFKFVRLNKVDSASPIPLAIDSTDASSKTAFETLRSWIQAYLNKKDSSKPGTGNTGGSGQNPVGKPSHTGAQSYKTVRLSAFIKDLPSPNALIAQTESVDQQVVDELAEMLFITDYPSTENEDLLAAPAFKPNFVYAATIISVLQDHLTANQSLALNANAINLEATSSTSLSGSTSSLETTIINGIVNWVVSTAKQELLEWALKNWYNKLVQDNISSQLLSNTLSVLGQFISDNSLNLSKYGALWNAAFQKDLSDLPVHFEDEGFVDTVIKAIAPSWDGATELAPLVAGSTTFAYGIYQKKNVVSILSQLATTYYTGESGNNAIPMPVFKKIVLFASILTNAFGQIQNNVYTPVSVNTLKSIDPNQWSDLIRMIYLRNKDEISLVFPNGGNSLLGETNYQRGSLLFGLISTLSTTYQAYLQATASTVNNNISGSSATKTLSNNDVANLVNLSLSVIKNVCGYIDSKKAFSQNPRAALYIQYLDTICNHVSQISEGIITQQYGVALNGAVGIMRGTADIIKADSPKQNLNTLAALSYMTIFGGFLADMVSAKTPADVQNSLEELIPQDQYKLKNTDKWSLSLSAYPGVFLGEEGIPKYATTNTSTGTSLNKKKNSQDWAPSASIYLPIGIDITRGFGKSCVGLFIQAFDLGAVMNYRITSTDTSTQSSPNISWQQLVSPGASLFWQIKNSPLVIAIGGNYTPGLRKVQQTGVTYDASAIRFGASLTIDVTALHIKLSKK